MRTAIRRLHARPIRRTLPKWLLMKEFLAVFAILALSLQSLQAPHLTFSSPIYVLQNGALTVTFDYMARPFAMVSPRNPVDMITNPGKEFLFYDGTWHPFGSPTSVKQDGPSSLSATFTVGPYTVVRLAQLTNYPALVFTYTVHSDLDMPSSVGFHLTVDYHPGTNVPSAGNHVEPVFVQFSSTYLSYSSPVVNRYNGSNIVVMQMKSDQFCFLAVDGRFTGKAALASGYPGVYSTPPVEGGTSVLGTDNAIAVELLDITVAAGGSVTFRASMGQDLALKLAQVWAFVTTL